MKKILALWMAMALLVCSMQASFAEEAQFPAGSVPEAGFSGMNDPNLLRYTEDTIYENLVTTLDSDEYFVENVSAIYISQEYIDELAYNSQANIYFGYTLQELSEQFQGKKYVFTLGDDGSTIVTEFEEYDDTYDRVCKPATWNKRSRPRLWQVAKAINGARLRASSAAAQAKQWPSRARPPAD